MNGFAMVVERGGAAGPDSEWLDDMVNKLMTVLEAQLNAVAGAEPKGDAQGRAADARTLSALERTLERLSRLERERAAIREKKIAKGKTGHGSDARETLERRLDQRLAAQSKKRPAHKS